MAGNRKISQVLKTGKGTVCARKIEDHIMHPVALVPHAEWFSIS